MSVEITFKGRLGNNMFQYAFGRIIAEHHGFELRCRPNPTRHPKRHTLEKVSSATLADFASHFSNAPLYIPGKRAQSPVEAYILGETPGWNGNVINMHSLLENRDSRLVRLSGYFQRYDYFRPYKQTIHKWFTFNPIPTPFTVSDKDVLISIRRGTDYAVHDWLLPLTYYKGILNRLNGLSRVYVCGTGIDEDVKYSLKDYCPIYFDASPLEHFSFFQRFSRIVLSNSTFAWWASFLSMASEVYIPVQAQGGPFGFRGNGNVNLVPDESRYVEIEVTSKDRAAFIVHSQVIGPLLRQRPSALTSGDTRNDAIDEQETAFMWWLASEQRPVTIDEMAQYYSGSSLAKTLAKLLRIGAVIIKPWSLIQYNLNGLPQSVKPQCIQGTSNEGLRPENHLGRRATRTKNRIAAAIFSFNRPEYLARVLDSLQKNSCIADIDFYFIQDGAVNAFSGRVAAADADIERCLVLWENASLPNKHVVKHPYNLGIGICQYKAKVMLFEELSYERVMFFEDDLVTKQRIYSTAASYARSVPS